MCCPSARFAPSALPGVRQHSTVHACSREKHLSARVQILSYAHGQMYAGWGIGMANELEVDAGGLRTAAFSSQGVGAGLTVGQLDAAASSQPSGAGVAAVNAALASVKTRQSARITGQADDLSVSSARYDTTDGDGRDAISGTVLV